MTNKKVTSNKIGSLAAKTLTDPSSSKTAKELAGSALSQMNKGNQTGSYMEDKASKVLQSNKYSEETKSLAASVLSQSNKKR
ncbi:hypothetical protein [Sphingobacterium siyangense]|uniref:hypothetical protein n=1 Tax=Sphingobacterium siyangense TaxID=459529 RepID=UPI003DA67F0C